MMVLVDGLSKWQQYAGSPHVGHLLTPAGWNDPSKFILPWACDNGCFGGLDAPAFLRMLAKIRGMNPLWVVAPDVVGDSIETLRRFGVWGPMIRELGFKVAFVGQDGAEDTDIPWEGFDALFIGGSTDWKLSQASADLCIEGKSRGKWVHVGRVNSYTRLRRCLALGVDSVDGRSWNAWKDTYLPDAIKWLEKKSGVTAEPLLDGVESIESSHQKELFSA